MKKRFISLAMLIPIALTLLQIEKAIAKPAATFDGTIGEMKRILPKNWIIRLPSNIYFSGKNGRVYTNSKGMFFRKDSQEFVLALHSEPNCLARACELGYLASSDSSSTESYAHRLLSRPIFTKDDFRKLDKIRGKDAREWTDAEQQHFIKSEGAILIREPITLKPGVKGTFVANRGAGVSTPSGMSVVWEQDGFTFRISIRGGAADSRKVNQSYKTQLINTAISMAKEQPIKSN